MDAILLGSGTCLDGNWQVESQGQVTASEYNLCLCDKRLLVLRSGTMPWRQLFVLALFVSALVAT